MKLRPVCTVAEWVEMRGVIPLFTPQGEKIFGVSRWYGAYEILLQEPGSKPIIVPPHYLVYTQEPDK